MKIKNNVDDNYITLLYAYFLSCLSFSITTLCIKVTTVKLGVITAMGIINLIIIYFIFNRYYRLNKNFLIIKVGPILKKISTKDIKKAYITSFRGISYTTSERCICIETKKHKYYISPKKMDEVLMQLIKYRGGKK